MWNDEASYLLFFGYLHKQIGSILHLESVLTVRNSYVNNCKETASNTLNFEVKD